MLRKYRLLNLTKKKNLKRTKSKDKTRNKTKKKKLPSPRRRIPAGLLIPMGHYPTN